MLQDELSDLIERAVKDEFWLRPNQTLQNVASAIAREVIRRMDEHDLIVKERAYYDPNDEYDELE